jgi:cupin superfamily acireductone dioxygenase involved in methionine salvage
MIEIPVQLEKYFTSSDFKSYPKLNIPQKFVDERGAIINIADGEIGDVAIIQSKKSSIRANHVHHSDWHLSYCLSGSLIYSYLNQELKVCSTRIFAGELFFTPEAVPHRMDFIEDTVLVVASRNSRLQARYEEDTEKYHLNLSEDE